MTKHCNLIEKTAGSRYFQKRTTCVLSLLNTVCTIVVLSNIFVLYTPPHRCTIPELDWINGTRPSTPYVVSSSKTAWNVSDINSTFALREVIPLDSGLDGIDQWNQCYRYSEDFTLGADGSNSTSNQTLIACDEGWTYFMQPGEISATMEFSLVCDKSWLNPLPTSIQLLGYMVGSIIGGYISDRYGRKPTLLISQVIASLAVMGIAWSPSISVLNVCTFLLGTTTITRAITVLIIANESTPKEQRNFTGTFLLFCTSIGNLLLALVAYLLPNWRWMLTSLSIAMMVVVPTLIWCIEETLTWLIQANKHQQVRRVLKKISRLNGIETDLQNLFMVADVTTGETDPKDVGSEQQTTLNYIDLVKISFLRGRLIKLGLGFFAVSVSYYGLSFNASRLKGDRYLNAVYQALAEVASYAVAHLLLRKYSCRQLFCISTSLCSICLIAAPFAKQAGESGEIICSMIGKFFITTSFMVVYLFIGDYFPTLLRNQAYGAASFTARLGGFFLPYLLYLGDVVHEVLPYAIMGVVTMIAAVAVFFLPETKGLDLPHTIEDAKALERFEAQVEICKKNDRLEIEKYSKSLLVSQPRDRTFSGLINQWAVMGKCLKWRVQVPVSYFQSESQHRESESSMFSHECGSSWTLHESTTSPTVVSSVNFLKFFSGGNKVDVGCQLE